MLSCMKQNPNGNALLVSDPHAADKVDHIKRIVGSTGQTNIAGGGWVIQMGHKDSYFAANCKAKMQAKDETVVFELDMGRETFGFPIKFFPDSNYVYQSSNELFMFDAHQKFWYSPTKDPSAQVKIDIEWKKDWTLQAVTLTSATIQSGGYKVLYTAKCATKEYLTNALGATQWLELTRKQLGKVPESQQAILTTRPLNSFNLNDKLTLAVTNRLAQIVTLRSTLFTDLASETGRREDLINFDLKKKPNVLVERYWTPLPGYNCPRKDTTLNIYFPLNGQDVKILSQRDDVDLMRNMLSMIAQNLKNNLQSIELQHPNWLDFSKTILALVWETRLAIDLNTQQKDQK